MRIALTTLVRIALTTLAAIASLVLVVQVVTASNKTTVATEAMKNPIQNTMSIYELHLAHPGMKTLPAEFIPLP
jgi:hypothetical protein